MTYRHILLPLDGSRFAEKALPRALEVAEGLGCRITLLRVVEPVPGYLSSPQKRQEQEIATATTYLDHAAPRSGRPITIDTHAMVGLAADGIVDFARANEISLIFLTTHGEGWNERYPMGSTAWKVIHAAPCDVLLVQT